MRLHNRSRDLSLILAGVLMGGLLFTPAGAHVTRSVSHLWGTHIKSKVTKLVYTKTQSDAKYLGKSATATNSNNLDGKDSSEFAPSSAEAWHEVGAAGEPPFNVGDLEGSSVPHEVCWWRNFDVTHNSAAFFKDQAGVVHIKGLVVAQDGLGAACGANTSYDIQMFRLPTGYRPAVRTVLTAMSNAKLMRIDIDPDGYVLIGADPEFAGNGFADERGWVSLDGISFRPAG